MEKFTLKQIKSKVGTKDKKLIEKVFLLANGMIEVHGFARDEAYEKALTIANEWRDNGEVYSKGKL
ncbi:MAG: hypothetical protein AAFX53_05415 [Bacteroidota bacterium]